jgi:hypothetical protein
VLHHLDPNAVQLERRAPWLIDSQRSTRWNASGSPDIVANKRDASVFGRGPEFNAYVSPAEVSESGNRNRSGKRALAARN